MIKLPNLGDQTMQIYGKFEGFRLNSALFGFGNIMTPVSALSRFHKHTLEILQIGPRCFCCQSDGGRFAPKKLRHRCLKTLRCLHIVKPGNWMGC